MGGQLKMKITDKEKAKLNIINDENWDYSIEREIMKHCGYKFDEELSKDYELISTDKFYNYCGQQSWALISKQILALYKPDELINLYEIDDEPNKNN